MDEEKTRAFVCVDFPDEVVKEVARIGELLSKTKFTGKLTELENLHLTLKFLGEISEGKMNEVREALRGVKMKRFEVKLGRIGIFSYHDKPRIVWIKVLGKGIRDLQKKVDEVLSECGFVREARFMSHLTVARVKHVKDLKNFYEYVRNLKVKEIEFYVSEFRLMKSDLRRMGPVYEEIEGFSLF
jgi:2'-5' RNA ligase